jgi:hypothetical protein
VADPTRLLVVMRSHGSENHKNRPEFYDKTVCLASLLRAADTVDPSPTLLFVNDGPVPARRERLMLGAGEVLQGEFGANRPSYRTSLAMAAERVGDDDLVWFAEDDYLYDPDAFVELLDAAARLPRADYFSLYLGELADREASAPQRTAWGPAVSTTSSFGVRGRQLREDVALLRLMPYTGGAFDHTTSLTVQGRYPFTRRELVADLLPVGAPASELPRALVRGAVRTALGLRAWRRPSRRRSFVQPPQDLVAHLEVGGFDPAAGWDAVAQHSRDWAAARSAGDAETGQAAG